ncbi:MAG TPA: hypothetical protein PK385_10085 [Spirochaetota bacterium]|nr:hypothetical protein [Spirochaetota bacterium]HQH31869.1 hypothetical protein [Spirochaetota bacterium]
MEKLSIWELFLSELMRNIKPSKPEIENQFKYFIEKKFCTEKNYNNLINVRFFAAYEQAINEYLHPPEEWRQGNIKSEMIHLGTIYEGS